MMAILHLIPEYNPQNIEAQN